MDKMRYPILLVLMAFLSIYSGCGQLNETTSDDRLNTTLQQVSMSKTVYYPKSYVDSVVTNIDATAGAPTGIKPVYDVNQYNITYPTTHYDGSTTVASAIMLVPSQNINCDMVVYLHGSTSLDSDAPSNTYLDIDSLRLYQQTGNVTDIDQKLNTEYALYLTLASEGKVIVIPDYLGFGISSGLHPYMHSTTLASVTIDAIRAAQSFASSPTVAFSVSDRIILQGYSEGGYAVMATHKELVTNASSYTDLTISAVMPGAPPCDLSDSMANTMLTADNTYPTPAFLPYLIYSYNMIYQFFGQASQFMVDMYSNFESHFDGSKSLGDISALLNNSAAIDMIKPSIKSSIQSARIDYIADNKLDTPTASGFYEKVIENDVYNYDPGNTVPYYLIHLNQDSTVPISNSIKAVGYMTQFGSAQLGTSGGNLFLLDPHLYVTSGGTDLNYANGTLTDHSAGFLYYYLVSRGILAQLF